ncbi:MAG: right-handed parallel beta-helix repeat-containing protein [Candidatus Peregrinibacteria bacterium]
MSKNNHIIFRTAYQIGALLLLSLATFLGFTGNASADTLINSDITQNTRWAKAKSPYVIYADNRDNITVQSGVTLTIEPGVTVKFSQATGLDVQGKLIAQGSPTEKITFTSLNDNHPLNTGTAYPGDWYGLFLRSNNSVLKWVHIKYAGREGFMGHKEPASLYVDGRFNHVTNSIIEKGDGNGIYLHYFYQGIVHNNYIGDHAQNGVLIDHSDTDLFQNTIQNNGQNGIEIRDRLSAHYTKGKISIHKNAIQNNGGSGIHVKTLLVPDIHDNQIEGNQKEGIRIETGKPRIHDNTVRNNGD